MGGAVMYEPMSWRELCKIGLLGVAGSVVLTTSCLGLAFGATGFFPAPEPNDTTQYVCLIASRNACTPKCGHGRLRILPGRRYCTGHHSCVGVGTDRGNSVPVK